LTSNPAAYLHPDLRGTTDLRRLTQVLRWINPALDESAVFEMQRENLFSLARSSEQWIQSLPPAIWDPQVDDADQGVSLPVIGRVKPSTWPVGWWSSGESRESRIYKRLPAALMTMEALIEDTERIAGHHAEIQSLGTLDISFGDWRRLDSVSDNPSSNAEMKYIVLDEVPQAASI
jgi:hypothetical protein